MGNTMQKSPENSQEEIEEFTCRICIQPISNKFENGNKCSHQFCTDCMIKYIRVKLDDHNVAHIMCPAVNCQNALDPHACAPLVGAPLFLRWCDVLCEATLVDSDKCYCPYQNCNVLIVNECGGNPKKSNCPSCKRLFCFKCKRAWHGWFRCEENGDVSDGNDIIFGLLAEQMRWMRCPRCRHCVELTAGCDFIRCRCGIGFCYKCGDQVNKGLCRCGQRTTGRGILCTYAAIGLICTIIVVIILKT